MIYHERPGAPGYFTSELLTVPHGFSTRKGGVSTLPYLSSMNFTVSTGDSNENVAENYRRFLTELGLPPDSRVSASQTHSAVVRPVGEADRGRVFDDCDGFCTACPDVTLIVKSADCVPILFADADAGVIGAVHAGWKGTVGGIAPRCVAEMVKLGASVSRIRAAVGACIHACCYEVRGDFVERVAALRGAAFADRYILSRAGRRYADLAAMNRALLVEAGLSAEAIESSPDCTCCRPALYHSHRATGGRRGVMAAAIALKNGGAPAKPGGGS